jgi:hypothetical protein
VHLQLAAARADALGNDELRARAWIAILASCLDLAGCDVSFASAQADGLLQRLGRPALLEAARLNAEGVVALGQRDLATAESRFTSALELRRQQLPKDHPLVARSLSNLALTLPPGRSVPVLISCLELRTRVFGERHPDTATAHHNLGQVLLLNAQCEAAAAHFESAASTWTSGPTVDLTRLADEQVSLAEVAVCLQKPGAAVGWLKQAAANMKAANAPTERRRGVLMLLLDLMKAERAPGPDLARFTEELQSL